MFSKKNNIEKNTKVTYEGPINICIPPNVDPKNVVFDLFNNCQLDCHSKITLNGVNSEVTGFKFRFFNSTLLEEKAKIKITDFNIDLEKDVVMLPDINLIIKEGAKVKISTSKETVFNSLKKISDINPKIEISLKCTAK